MKHLLAAYEAMDNWQKMHIAINEIGVGFGHQLSMNIQSVPVGMAEINALQATDLLEFTKHLFESFNKEHHCKENDTTIQLIDKALYWQHLRTQDRELRGVEGKNES